MRPLFLTIFSLIIWILGRSYTERQEWAGKRPLSGQTTWPFVRITWNIICFGFIFIVLFDTPLGGFLSIILLLTLIKYFYLITKGIVLPLLKVKREKIPNTEKAFITISLFMGLGIVIYLLAPEESTLSDTAVSSVAIGCLVISIYALLRVIHYLLPKPKPIKNVPKIKKDYHDLFMRKLEKIVSIINMTVSVFRIIFNYTKGSIMSRFRKPVNQEINGAYTRIMNNPKSKNIQFTLIEQLDHMTIFHGHSKNTITEKNLREIELMCQSKGDASVSASLENNDPHLFKIVMWQDNPSK